MNTAACLLGTLLVATPAPTLVADRTQVKGQLIAPTTFAPTCGIDLTLACRVVNGRTNWSVMAWAVNGQLNGMTTQRDSDAFPLTVTTTWPRAYHNLVVQRTVTGPQWLSISATRVDGCRTTMRVDVP